MAQQRPVLRLVQRQHGVDETLLQGAVEILAPDHHMAGDRRRFGDPDDLRLLFGGEQEIGVLARRGGIDQPRRHRLHRLLIAAGEVHPAEERARVLARGQQAVLNENVERIEIARLRDRVGEGDVAPAQVGGRGDAAVAAHEDPAGIDRRAAIDLGQQRLGADLGLGQHEGQRAHERDVGVAVAQRLDGGGMVDGHEAADRHPDPLRQPGRDHLDIADQLLRVLLRNEGEGQAALAGGEPGARETQPRHARKDEPASCQTVTPHLSTSSRRSRPAAP